jgi:hypothetical protein
MEETKRGDAAAAAAQMQVWIRMRAASHAAAFLYGDCRPVPPPPTQMPTQTPKS